jgi:hypothetical protein
MTVNRLRESNLFIWVPDANVISVDFIVFFLIDEAFG